MCDNKECKCNDKDTDNKECKCVDKPRGRTYCWFCGAEMIWGADFSFEDYGYDGEGIVANMSCPNCGATAEFCTSFEAENGEE